MDCRPTGSGTVTGGTNAVAVSCESSPTSFAITYGGWTILAPGGARTTASPRRVAAEDRGEGRTKPARPGPRRPHSRIPRFSHLAREFIQGRWVCTEDTLWMMSPRITKSIRSARWNPSSINVLNHVRGIAHAGLQCTPHSGLFKLDTPFTHALLPARVHCNSQEARREDSRAPGGVADTRPVSVRARRPRVATRRVGTDGHELLGNVDDVDSMDT